jgi:hypothetical protein
VLVKRYGLIGVRKGMIPPIRATSRAVEGGSTCPRTSPRGLPSAGPQPDNI